MIDLSKENVLSLTEATKHLPRRRKGKRPHVATLYRWAQQGIRGVRLETIRVGGTMCTSLESLQRFCQQLTQAGAPSAEVPPSRRQSADRADRELEEMGI